jgi:hypothetical protein
MFSTKSLGISTSQSNLHHPWEATLEGRLHYLEAIEVVVEAALHLEVLLHVPLGEAGALGPLPLCRRRGPGLGSGEAYGAAPLHAFGVISIRPHASSTTPASTAQRSYSSCCDSPAAMAMKQVTEDGGEKVEEM